MKKIVIVLYGTPGSGKGQQAELLAERFNLVHLDTGKILRSILHDPVQLKDPIVRRERKLNDAGILNTPSWFVNAVMKKRITSVAKMGYGIVFSGSPRTHYEAEHMVPLLEKLYGRKVINFFFLRVPLKTAAKRNAERYICFVCQRPLLTAYYPSRHPTHCPVCAGKLIRRIDDDPSKFVIRTKEYETRTKSAIDYVRRRGYRMVEVDGAPAPFKVFGNIIRKVK